MTLREKSTGDLYAGKFVTYGSRKVEFPLVSVRRVYALLPDGEVEALDPDAVAERFTLVRTSYLERLRARRNGFEALLATLLVGGAA